MRGSTPKPWGARGSTPKPSVKSEGIELQSMNSPSSTNMTTPPTLQRGRHMDVAEGAIKALYHLQAIQMITQPAVVAKFEKQAEIEEKRHDKAGSIMFRLFNLMDNPSSSTGAKIVAVVILTLIVVSCVSFVVETLPVNRYPRYGNKEGDSPPIFRTLEIVCVTAFTVEYLIRIVTVKAVPERILAGMGYSTPVIELRSCGGPFRLKWLGWAKSPLNLIDLLAILPFYIVELASSGTNASGGFLTVLRVLRLTRVFRVFKLGKYAEGLFLFAKVIMKSLSALYLLFFFMVISTIVFGSMIYYAERGHYDSTLGYNVRPNIFGDDEQTPFTSIPRSFWWVIVTSTTVGYGDMVPTTHTGMLIGTVAMYFGILVLAMPLAIISSNFQQISAAQKKDKTGYKNTRLGLVARLLELQQSLERTNSELSRVFTETKALCAQYLQLETHHDRNLNECDVEEDERTHMISESKLTLDEFCSMQEQMHSLLKYKKTVATRIKRLTQALVDISSAKKRRGSSNSFKSHDSFIIDKGSEGSEEGNEDSKESKSQNKEYTRGSEDDHSAGTECEEEEKVYRTCVEENAAGTGVNGDGNHEEAGNEEYLNKTMEENSEPHKRNFAKKSTEASIKDEKNRGGLAGENREINKRKTGENSSEKNGSKDSSEGRQSPCRSPKKLEIAL